MKTILVDAVNTFVIEGAGVYKPLFELLERYSNPKIIVTNANDEQITTFGLVNLPYPLFTLKHQPDKVDPTYFKILFEQLNLSPSDVVYFEHNPAAVASAQSLGITTFHYDHVAKDLTALKIFLDTNLLEQHS